MQWIFLLWKMWTALVENVFKMENVFSRLQQNLWKVNTKHSSKLSDFSIIPNFLTLIDFLLGLIDQYTGRKRGCCTFRTDNYYYLINLSWVLLLHDCLERRSLHIIAELDEHITFVSFWKLFLMPLSWLCLYGIFVIHAYYMFLWYTPTVSSLRS